MIPGDRVRIAGLPAGHPAVGHVGRTGLVDSSHDCVVTGDRTVTVRLFQTCDDCERHVVVPAADLVASPSPFNPPDLPDDLGPALTNKDRYMTDRRPVWLTTAERDALLDRTTGTVPPASAALLYRAGLQLCLPAEAWLTVTGDGRVVSMEPVDTKAGNPVSWDPRKDDHVVGRHSPDPYQRLYRAVDISETATDG